MMSSKSVRAHLKSSSHRLSDVDEIALNVEKVQTVSSSAIGNGNGDFSVPVASSSGALATGVVAPLPVGDKKNARV